MGLVTPKQKEGEAWSNYVARCDERKRKLEGYVAMFLCVAVVSLIGGCAVLMGDAEKDNKEDWKQECRDNGFRVVYIQQDIICVDDGKTVLRYSERTW